MAANNVSKTLKEFRNPERALRRHEKSTETMKRHKKSKERKTAKVDRRVLRIKKNRTQLHQVSLIPAKWGNIKEQKG